MQSTLTRPKGSQTKSHSNFYNQLLESSSLKELKSILHDEIQKKVPFDGIFFCFTDAANILLFGEELKETIGLYNAIEEKKDQDKKVELVKSVPHKGIDAYIKFIDKTIHEKKGPIIENLKLSNTKYNHPFLVLLNNLNYKEALIIPIRSGETNLGSVWLTGSKNNQFKNTHLTLMAPITVPVFFKLKSFIAQKEAVEASTEKEIIQSLNEAISTTRDTKQLWKVMLERVKPIIGFKIGVTTLYSQDYSKYCYYLDCSSVDYNKNAHHPIIQLNKFFPIAHTSDEWVLKNGGDLCAMTTEEKKQWCMANPEVIQILKDNGIVFNIYAKIYERGKVIGVQHYHFDYQYTATPQSLSFIRSITDLISIALSNVMAHEKTQKTVEENSLILHLGTELSLKRSTEDIISLLNEKIGPLLYANKIMLILPTEDKEQYEIVNYQENNEKESFFKSISAGITIKNQFDIESDPLFSDQNSVQNKSPFYTPIKEVLKKCPTHILSKLLENSETLSAISFILRTNEEILGVLLWSWDKEIQHPERYFKIIQGVGDFTSIAISNLFGQLKLKQRSKEIEHLNTKLLEQNAYLEKEILGDFNPAGSIGESIILKSIYHHINLVSKSDTTVLITGETGTGKELIARAIHEASDRKNKPLIKINCAALPSHLIESELFGHEKGSFTGAIEKRIGKFELANGSTIFLDEIGELPLELQSKLLRVLQEKEFERIGGNRTITTDVRIVSATNRDLHKEVSAGKFRSDLYYRLNVFPIHLPPLRERTEDIPLLVHYFIQKYQKKLGKNIVGVSRNVMNKLMEYSWPGNIRELEHVIERSFILCNDSTMKNIYLPTLHISESKEKEEKLKSFSDMERAHIIEVLQHCKGKVSGPGGAAEILQLKPTTLEFKMKKLGITRQFL